MEYLLGTNKKHIFIFAIVSLLCSCCNKNYNYTHIECTEIPREAVFIAISDFSKIFEKQKYPNNVCAVYVHINFTSTDWFYITLIPRIRDSNKYDLEELDMYMGQIPPSNSNLPTEYIIKNNVLYVWRNPQQVLTQDVKNVLAQYYLISYPKEEEFYVIGGSSVSYIFCKSNFKKRYHNKVIDASYTVPLPSCRCGISTDNK